MRSLVGILFLSLIHLVALAQPGGKRAFEFLNLAPSARPAALAGPNVSSFDGDVAMHLQNPALLDSTVARKASLSYVPYLADIQFGTLAYAHPFRRLGLLGFGLQYMNYGAFDGYDEFENSLGTFTASDWALSLAYAHQVDAFSFGLGARWVQSQLFDFRPSALLFDFSTTFRHPEQDMLLAVVFKNMGAELSREEVALPSDIRVGLSVKPEHMPVRMSVTAYNLFRNNLAYFDSLMEASSEAPNTLEKLFRHFAFGAELVLSSHVNLRAGYNHLMRQSLGVEGTGDLAGFSFGFLIRVKKWKSLIPMPATMLQGEAIILLCPMTWANG
ncbi:MAG: type IX secretion system protein PorQ [Cytophagales bacterium]|nr:type IX secretion system protein PorQ [Cytophagales bacterium]